MTRRIAITGGSGFIGTNLVAYFMQRREPVISIDLAHPRNPDHNAIWRRVDLRDAGALTRALTDFSPTHVVHLAAKTDLLGKSLDDYRVNTEGLTSLIQAMSAGPKIERALLASSMLVCKAGYIPKDDQDYAPSTWYGESKVLGERFIRNTDCEGAVWSIIRPTSIWGPWFGEPYFNFFRSVVNRRFVTFRGLATKTFGYVGNTVWQIAALLDAEDEEVHRKTVYLGDAPPLPIDEWARGIAAAAHCLPPLELPRQILSVAAKIGDALGHLGIRAPITSFRLSNMTTNNKIPLDLIYSIAGTPPYSVEHGIRETLRWLAEGRPHSNGRKI